MLEEAFGSVIVIQDANRLELRALAFQDKPDLELLAKLGVHSRKSR